MSLSHPCHSEDCSKTGDVILVAVRGDDCIEVVEASRREQLRRLEQTTAPIHHEIDAAGADHEGEPVGDRQKFHLGRFRGGISRHQMANAAMAAA